MRIIFIGVLVFSISCNSPSLSTLEKVRALDLNLIEGNIKTYYSDEHKDRAVPILNLLQESTGFFEEHFEVKQPFSIAVLDSANWAKVTSIPYGLPFVSGPPYIVCFPADSDNILSDTIAAAIDEYEFNSKYSMTNKEIVELFFVINRLP